MRIQSLHDLYRYELKDLYSAENQLTKALPRMAKAAQTSELRAAFEAHLRQTEQHAQRLEKIFSELDEKPRGRKCVGMEGLIAEGQELLKEDIEPEVMDAALIGAAQRIEHYEIAGYGTARAYAQQLGLGNHADLLQKTLDEETAADKMLTQIAEGHANLQAEEVVAGEEQEV